MLQVRKIILVDLELLCRIKYHSLGILAIICIEILQDPLDFFPLILSTEAVTCYQQHQFLRWSGDNNLIYQFLQILPVAVTPLRETVR